MGGSRETRWSRPARAAQQRIGASQRQEIGVYLPDRLVANVVLELAALERHTIHGVVQLRGDLLRGQPRKLLEEFRAALSDRGAQIAPVVGEIQERLSGAELLALEEH